MSKRSRYGFVPAVVSAYGGWHLVFAQWLCGFVESSGAMAVATKMLWRAVGFLSVTLQRQDFLVLSGCVPVLANRATGQLGRPLSEIPEFWRAAPDTAVQ